MGSWVCCMQGRCVLVRCMSGCSEVGVVKMGVEMAGWCRGVGGWGLELQCEKTKRGGGGGGLGCEKTEKEGREDERRNRGREGGGVAGRCRGSAMGVAVIGWSAGMNAAAWEKEEEEKEGEGDG
ncbi:hypothetical protein MRB53_032926 [Persea americana]|uniref:Uncharacterized protein n=1 Tax=Persea americana TaxID=3435 RepID=A0ACC2KU45_PERAE|nr:hypothetical protein MRB53_032926 [Persea americana]